MIWIVVLNVVGCWNEVVCFVGGEFVIGGGEFECGLCSCCCCECVFVRLCWWDYYFLGGEWFDWYFGDVLLKLVFCNIDKIKKYFFCFGYFGVVYL